MPVSEAMNLIQDGSGASTTDALFSRLLRANFIGLETDVDRFDFPAAEQTEKRARILASKLEKSVQRETRVTVHPAFRPYLGIKD